MFPRRRPWKKRAMLTYIAAAAAILVLWFIVALVVGMLIGRALHVGTEDE